MQSSSGVYAIITEPRQFVKVGVANRVESRLISLQSGSPFPLSVGHYLPCDKKDAVNIERFAHWQLAEHHTIGEWFSCSLEAAIEAITYGLEKVNLGHGAIRFDSARKKVNPQTVTPSQCKAAREHLGLGVVNMAGLCSVSPYTYSQFEKGSSVIEGETNRKILTALAGAGFTVHPSGCITPPQ